MIAEPPFAPGAVHVTVACASPAVAVPIVGAPATVALLSSVRPEQAGTASGVSNTFRQVGSVFGVALTGTLLIRHLGGGVPDALGKVQMDPAVRQQMGAALSAGDLGAIGRLPAKLQGPVMDAVAPVFTDGLRIGFTAAAVGTLIGGLFALWVTGTPFSVSSGIGFLALFGVSVQTAVVYISYVNELRGAGMDLTQAIREGALLRLRPIMMTALVAALGLLPAALATGVGTDSQRPFALVIVSGLFSRLAISIFLMPTLYALVARPGDRLEV